jgi:hypothetical protein
MTEQERLAERLNYAIDEGIAMWDLAGKILAWGAGILGGAFVLLIVVLMIVNKMGITP